MRLLVQVNGVCGQYRIMQFEVRSEDGLRLRTFRKYVVQPYGSSDIKDVDHQYFPWSMACEELLDKNRWILEENQKLKERIAELEKEKING